MSSDLFTDDETNSLLSPARGRKAERELTGSMVLGLMVAFFAVIVGVNAFMAHEALSTFGGVDTDSAYQAGRLFEREVAKAQAQDAQHWQVEAKVARTGDGLAALDVSARDASGAPLAGMSATAQFERPTDRRLDRSVVVNEDTAGHFHGSADVATGQWDLIIELSRHGERMFRSKNRVIIR